jgi:DNA-binding winged helix-turn-helix (wHTH) protein/Tol biopolymer transport system component
VVETSNRKVQQINFGECCYYPDTAKISIKRKTSHISPTPARILIFLCNNQNIALTLQDIKEHVWSKKYNEVADITVHAHLSALRKSLGDNYKPHRYIVCNKNWTYKLKPPAEIIYTKSPREKNSFVKKIAAFSMLAVIGATAYGFALTKSIPVHYTMSGTKQLTTFKGGIDFATVSPNKQLIVFAHKKEGAHNWGLMAKQRGSERYNTLIRDEVPLMHNMEPDFSPSGKKLSWVRTNYQEHCMVMIADFIEVELKIENEKEILDCSQDYYARFPQWKDENTLLVSLPQGNNQVNAIFEIDLKTSKTKKITDPVGALYGELGIFYNKNNKKIAHLRRSNVAGFWSELMIYDFNTGQDKLLKSYTYPLYSVAWVDETRLLAKSETGFEVITLDAQVTLVKRANADEGFMPFSLGDEKFGFIDGDLVARDIEVINLNNNTVNKDLSSVRHDFRPVVAKNSGDFAFVSKRSGRHQIYATVNGIPKQITHFKNYLSIAAMAISPDGELIAFIINSQLNIIDRNGQYRHKENVTVSGISFTLDGQGFLYGAESHGGWSIRYLSLSGEDKDKVTTVTDGFMPKSANGGFVYFLRNVDGTDTLYRKSLQSADSVQNLGPAPFQSINSNSFDVIDNQLYYVLQNNKDQLLVKRDLTTGEISPVSPISNSLFSLNHDATVLIASKKDEAQNNLIEFELIESNSK